MIRYVAIVMSIALSSLSAQAQEIIGSPDFIEVRMKDRQFIDDTMNEALRSAIIKAVWNDNRLRHLLAVRNLTKVICECSDEEYEDLINDRALPSFKRKQEEARLTKSQQARFDYEMAAADTAKVKADLEGLRLMSLSRELAKRMIQAFIDSKPIQNLSLNQYMLDLERRGFRRRHQNEFASSIEVQSENQIGTYLKAQESQIAKAVDAARLKPETKVSGASKKHVKPKPIKPAQRVRRI